ncbi:MAG: hypothetical protein NE327_12400 [Lentisphaeraceae bacterium]|nr:hypothetical protein [Lentisphaeraceae bacterium]
MSLDTITRVETYLETNIWTPNSYDYENFSINEVNDHGSGPWALVIVTPASTAVSGMEAAEHNLLEEGVITIQIFQEKYAGNRNNYTMAKTIRDTLVTVPQLKLYPTGSEEGVIHIYNLEQRGQPVEVEREDGEDPWIRLDIFVAYKKYFDIT